MLRRSVIHLGFTVVFAALLAIGFYSSRAVRVLYSDSKSMSSNRELSRRVRTLLISLLDTETGQRGYLLTGNQAYLAPYEKGRAEVDENFERVRQTLTDFPSHATELGRLADLKQRKLAEMADTVKRYQKGETAAARDLVATDQGKALMDEIRNLLKTIDDEADEGVRRWESNLERSRSELTRGLVLLLAVGLALLLTLCVLILRLLSEQQRMQAELADRVTERTAQLGDANAALQNEVAERRRTAEILQQSNLELSRSNRELEDFAYVASHDLQEPLRKIQAFGARLKTKHGASWPPEAQDYLARMQNAAQRMETLIRDLLAYSRITTQGKPFQPTDLNEILKGVLGDLEELLTRTGGTVESESLPVLPADPLQMRQLLQNLVANALKFHRAGVAPVVRVESRTLAQANGQPSQVELTVTDNGIGFEEKYLDKIFQPFQRLHARQAYEGTGMGLAVCRKIVERHNGTITARSTPDMGTTFIVSLPQMSAQGEINDAV